MILFFHSQGPGGRVIGGCLATVYKCSPVTPGRGLLDAFYLSIRSRKSAMLSPVNILPYGLAPMIVFRHKGHYSMAAT